MYLRQIDFAILIAVRDATPLLVYGFVTPQGDFSSRRCLPTRVANLQCSADTP
jgi:hypothetical protein